MFPEKSQSDYILSSWLDDASAVLSSRPSHYF